MTRRTSLSERVERRSYSPLTRYEFRVPGARPESDYSFCGWLSGCGTAGLRRSKEGNLRFRQLPTPSLVHSAGARVERERVGAMNEQTNLGAGNQEPDPATAENPPSDIAAGDKIRDTAESPSHRSDRLDTGISQEKNIDPESPVMPSGDQGG